MNLQIDIRPVLPAVRVPALVLHRTDDRAVEIDRGRDLAESIAGARFVELAGIDHLPWLGDVDSITDTVAEFLTGTLTAGDDVDTVLTTILSTALDEPCEGVAAPAGAQRSQLLASYDARVRRELARYRGRAVETSGVGVLATFDGPSRAIRCACALREAARALGLTMRAGVHTGEVSLRGGDVVGPAVEIGAAVAASAEAGEVLVSGTVTDLVAGSGLRFTEREMHCLPGVPGQWRLFTAHLDR
jgi:class 3 adenylate cyclase